MSKARFEVEYSKVTVTFIDGQVKEYIITAAPTISTHLARTSGETGTLVLFNAETSSNIPVSQIREYELEPYFPPKEEQ